MSDLNEEKLKHLEAQVRTINETKIRTEAQLEELRRQRDEILQRLSQMNIDPNSLDEQIKQLEQQLQNDLTNIESQIPEGF